MTELMTFILFITLWLLTATVIRLAFECFSRKKYWLYSWTMGGFVYCVLLQAKLLLSM